MQKFSLQLDPSGKIIIFRCGRGGENQGINFLHFQLTRSPDEHSNQISNYEKAFLLRFLSLWNKTIKSEGEVIRFDLQIS